MSKKTIEFESKLLAFTLIVFPLLIQIWLVFATYSPSQRTTILQRLNPFTPSPQTPDEQITKNGLQAILSKANPSLTELDTMFRAYANYYQINYNLLRHIAYCESTFNPKATNHIYAGLYQFNVSTWKVTRERMNLDPNPNLRFEPEEAIKTAAFKISNGGINAWPHCSGTYTRS